MCVYVQDFNIANICNIIGWIVNQTTITTKNKLIRFDSKKKHPDHHQKAEPLISRR